MTDNNKLTGALPSDFGKLPENITICYLCKIRVARLLSCLIFGSHQLTSLLFSTCLYFKVENDDLSDPSGVAGNCAM
jgi:hypothetical protein